MFAEALNARLARHGIHYAWVIAAVAFLTMLSAAAALGLPGAFLQPLSREFGWNVEQISSALAVRFALFGIMGPFAAILIERYGLRQIVTIALLLVATGLALATQMSTLSELMVLWGFVLGFGSGMIAMVLAAIVANRWFEQRRGLVLGALAASAATGQLAFLPLAAWLIETYGWRVAIVPSMTLCVLVAGLAFCLLRNRPADLGLQPYGAAPLPAGSPVPVAAPAAKPSFLLPLQVLRDALPTPAFWVLAGTFFICGLSTNGLIQTHFIALCGDYGLAAVPAASVLAMMGLFDFIGTIVSGWLSDRYDSRKLLFWYYGLRGLSLLWLPHSEFTIVGLSLFAVFYGLDWIATVPPTVKLANEAFGKERAPMVFGWIFAAHQLGGAVAAYGAGMSRNVLASYTPALYAAGIACVLAAVAVFSLRRPKPSPLPQAA